MESKEETLVAVRFFNEIYHIQFEDLNDKRTQAEKFIAINEETERAYDGMLKVLYNGNSVIVSPHPDEIARNRQIHLISGQIPTEGDGRVVYSFFDSESAHVCFDGGPRVMLFYGPNVITGETEERRTVIAEGLDINLREINEERFNAGRTGGK